MCRKIIAVISLLFIFVLVHMHSFASVYSKIDTVTNRLEQQKWLYPQERVSVSTDAEEYAPGDTIFMEVRIVDSSSLQPSELSRFAYVELTDPFGIIPKRVKLKNTGHQMHGYFVLPSEMTEGIYTLTGYTRLMESTGPDYFFTMPVYIYGSGRPDILPSFSFLRKGDSLRITTDLGSDSSPAVIELSSLNGKTYSSQRKKRNHTFELKKDEWRQGVALAKIGNYGLFIPLPPDSTDLQVAIKPEGGSLVHDIINSVGIQIRDIAGRGIGLKGNVTDSHGNFITSIETDGNGFGSFRLLPVIGETYKVELAGESYDLPPVKDDAVTLQVNPYRKNVVSVVPTGKVPLNPIILIHARGNLSHYGVATKGAPYTFRKSDLHPGVNEICLLDSDLNILSRRMVFIDSEIDRSLLLDADIPGFRTQAYGFDTNTSDSSGRIAIDNVMLGSGEWCRYNIKSVLKGTYYNPTAELEVGGEISGIVKSRWKGKPVADAEVSIISSDIDYCNSTKTDSEGHFTFNGIDWPEGTRFVVKVVNANGDYEDNFTIYEDSYPSVNHIVPAFDGNVYVVKGLDNADIKNRLSKWLDEVVVTAISKKDDEDDITKIYEIIGGRTVDQDYFEHRAITTYEAAISAFSGLVIKNGRVMNNGKDVEIWVDGVKWEAAYESSKSVHELGVEAARKRAELNTANNMTGGLLPPDLALAHYSSTKLPLSELASSFPFHTVDKIIYMRPSSALIVSNHAAFAGGALMIYTKNKNYGKHVNFDIHLKIISPLGYQNGDLTKDEQ